LEADVRSPFHYILRQLLNWCNVARDMIPDIALLRLFDFYLMSEEQIDPWQILVHVCQKWRNVAFGSSRRLNLRLYCDSRTPVRDMLDIWPPLPIVIKVNSLGVHNIIAALKHNDRISEITCSTSSGVTKSEMENILAEMQQPFPALTRLHLWFQEPHMVWGSHLIPASFLGGSAPRLQTLSLDGLPFPELPKLLLSTTHLVRLDLLGIPYSGNIFPEEMVTGLSVLTRLESLVIEFPYGESPQRPFPPTRVLLAVLTELRFKGSRMYLEDFVARFDAPLLDKLKINYSQQVYMDSPQLTEFIIRTPKLNINDEAHVAISEFGIRVKFPQTFDGELELEFSCPQSYRQLWSLVALCSSKSHHLVPTIENLYIFEDKRWSPHWLDDLKNSQWEELFESFTALKGLYISREFVTSIAPSLQELAEPGMEVVLPALQTLFLEDPLPPIPVQAIIGQLITSRQLANHPIAVSRWEREHLHIE
jgi:hypothetical protein